MAPRSNVWIVAAASLVLAACGGPQKPRAAVDPITPAKAAYSNVVVDPAMLQVATDACATQLHDICGPLLEYYAVTHHLPPTLRALAAFSTDPLNFTCPVSGELYVYRPVTLRPDERVLIMWDRTPVHSNMRWGILAGPVKGVQHNQLDMETIPVTDEIFKRYLPAEPTGEGTGAATLPGAALPTATPVTPPAETQPGAMAPTPGQ